MPKEAVRGNYQRLDIGHDDKSHRFIDLLLELDSA